MRLFLLPLSTRQALIYCHKSARNATAKLSITERLQHKVAETWAKWEKEDKGWQKQVVKYGNAGLQRIPYEEWGLKSFPPASANLEAEAVAAGKKYEVVYPGNVMRESDVPKVLARLARDRKQLHWNRFIGSIVAMPFLLPFALVPVIPNLPLFYVIFRAWSHWRALKGSDHLSFILDNRLFRPISNPKLEELYEKIAPDSPDFRFVTRSEVLDGTAPKEQMLLTSHSHELVEKATGVHELGDEVERAVWQVQRQLSQAQERQKSSGGPADEDSKSQRGEKS